MSASVKRIAGVSAAELNYASGTLLVEHDPAVNVRADVEQTVRASGHGIISLDAEAGDEDQPARPFVDRYRTEIAAIGGGVFAAAGGALGLAGASDPWVTGAFAISIVFGGVLVWRRAIVSLRARRLDMNVLMTIAVAGAAALGEWGEGATVFFLFALGGWLESRSLERTRRSIQDLMDLSPPVARLVRGASAVEVPAAEVIVGDVVLVRPGERVPVDGEITSGSSAIDEAPITGESVPVDKAESDAVFAGSLNTTGLLTIRATAAEDSTLARIVYLVEEAQGTQAPSQRLVDRFSAWYTPTVVAFAVALATVPPLVGTALGATWADPLDWIGRALVMLVVACPCALVISTPVSIVSAITRSTRDGVLVKGGAFLEAAASVRAVAFDKTGTLTCGEPEVVEVVPLGPESAAEALSAAGALEAHSTHPVARAVAAAAAGSGLPSVSDVHDVPGRGVRGLIEGRGWSVGSPALAAERGVADSTVEKAVEAQEALGRTVLVLAREDRAVALIAVADAVRPQASGVLAALRQQGIEHTVMLTGDNERTAEAVAERVGVDGFFARLLPAAKADSIRVLKDRFSVVAMVGDGVNDAPALAVSDVGIAMGAAGSDTAIESADIALMSDDLEALPRFFALGRRTVRIIRQNVWFAIVIKFAVLALALAGVANLWMAVFADTGVSLLVILNGMRLLRSR